MILSFFNRQIYQRILLPSRNNADFYFYLGSARFWMEEDLYIHLEVLNKKWRLCPHESYRVFLLQKNNELPLLEPFSLVDKAEFRIVNANSEALTMTVREEDHELHSYTRLMLHNNTRFTVGSDEKCEIRYVEGDRVKDFHAMVNCRNKDAKLIALAQEGVYLNGMVVRGTHELSFGDIIDVYGLRMVYLQDAMAVDTAGAILAESLEKAPQQNRNDAEQNL